MKRFFCLFLLLFSLSACIPATAVPVPATNTPTSIPPTDTPMPPTTIPEPTRTPIPSVVLRHGVNLGDMLEAPNEGEWGLFVQEGYFDLIKESGFDFVRLPVRWNTHAGEECPYTIDSAFFARVDRVIN